MSLADELLADLDEVGGEVEEDNVQVLKRIITLSLSVESTCNTCLNRMKKSWRPLRASLGTMEI